MTPIKVLSHSVGRSSANQRQGQSVAEIIFSYAGHRKEEAIHLCADSGLQLRNTIAHTNERGYEMGWAMNSRARVPQDVSSRGSVRDLLRKEMMLYERLAGNEMWDVVPRSADCEVSRLKAVTVKIAT